MLLMLSWKRFNRNLCGVGDVGCSGMHRITVSRCMMHQREGSSDAVPMPLSAVWDIRSQSGVRHAQHADWRAADGSMLIICR